MKAALSREPALDTIALEEPPEMSPGVDLLERLEGICAARGLESLAERLGDLADFLGQDVAQLEGSLEELPRDPRLVGRSATHLLDLGGKRLRPICVALASRIGKGFDPRVLDLGVAVELVHSATLLHDDVVDWSDARRGGPTSRVVYGNAASIFAGDWLLIEALRRVERVGVPGLLSDLFGTIEEMIFAESLQLENRGKVSPERETYFQITEGKTASVFRWAMRAGGKAGEVGDEGLAALETFGLELGIAFQAVDDLLDLTGDPALTGKSLFTDLREGKMTFPLILALENDGELRRPIEEALAFDPAGGADLPPALVARIIETLETTRAVEDTLTLARERSASAISALSVLPPSRARFALETVAEAIVDRDL